MVHLTKMIFFYLTTYFVIWILQKLIFEWFLSQNLQKEKINEEQILQNDVEIELFIKSFVVVNI